jgi:hypothetical protein
MEPLVQPAWNSRRRRPESDMVCVYDIKTGRAGLSSGRLLQIGLEVNKHFGAARFIVIEIRPFE